MLICVYFSSVGVGPLHPSGPLVSIISGAFVLTFYVVGVGCPEYFYYAPYDHLIVDRFRIQVV